MAPDMEQRIAQDKKVVHLISSADADLSMEQTEVVAQSARLLERDRALPAELRTELQRIFELLPELISND